MDIFGKLALTFVISGVCAIMVGGILWGDKPSYEKPGMGEKVCFCIFGAAAVGFVGNLLAWIWMG